MGSGTVKGFAQTLALGILLSMFTALVVTRFVLKALYQAGIRDPKFYGLTKRAKNREFKVINFLGKKNICFICSAVVILVGVGALIFNSTKGTAFNYSLEFRGGTSTNVTFNEDQMCIRDRGYRSPHGVTARYSVPEPQPDSCLLYTSRCV